MQEEGFLIKSYSDQLRVNRKAFWFCLRIFSSENDFDLQTKHTDAMQSLMLDVLQFTIERQFLDTHRNLC